MTDDKLSTKNCNALVGKHCNYYYLKVLSYFLTFKNITENLLHLLNYLARIPQ